MRQRASTLAAALWLAASLAAAPAHAEATAGPAAAEPGAVKIQVAGHWAGAKLRCQKEEGKLVRCGTPAPFEVTFADNGTGSSLDESFPKEFSWRWLAPKEMALTPGGGGEEIKLFGFEQEEESILTFQAYVFLPTADPNAPAEARYIHYVFDVNRTQ